MTKDQVIQELKEKLKLGIKPSDLKNNKEGVLPDFNLPPSDEGYESDSNVKTIQTKTPLKKDQIKQLQAQVKFEANKAQSYLTNLQRTVAELDQAQQEIQHLQSQPSQLSQETEQAIAEANQKIRQLIKTNEELQAKNQTLNKTLTELKKPAKISEETNPEEAKNFTCSSCTQAFNIELLRLAKKSGKKVCRHCTLAMLKRANQITGKHIVLKIKKQPEANPPPKTFLCQTCQQPQPREPHQVHITNYQDQGINPRQLANICSPCLQDKVVLANFYCPRTSEGRDTWNPKEPQFDCDCPNERRNQ
jgi:myosin heavy subunit